MTTYVNPNKKNKKGRSKEWLENYKNQCNHNKKQNSKNIEERLMDLERQMQEDPSVKEKVTNDLIKELEKILKVGK